MGIPETRYATTEEGIASPIRRSAMGLWTSSSTPRSSGTSRYVGAGASCRPVRQAVVVLALDLHDCRGTGLSGGYSFPNLETRARDLLTVLDACRSSRAALFGGLTGGAALAMFAATYPDRVSSFAWFSALARTSWSPEYPWGDTPEEQRQTVEGVREFIGKPEAVRDWFLENGPGLVGDERLIGNLAGLDRHFIAP